MSYLYDIQWLRVSPVQLGEPVDRDRLYITGLLKACLTRTMPLDAMLEHLQRRRVATQEIYWAFPEDMARALYIEPTAKKCFKVAEPEKQLTWYDTLPERLKTNLQGYMEIRGRMISENKLKESDPIVCDLMHNPNHQQHLSTGATLRTLATNMHRFCVHR